MPVINVYIPTYKPRPEHLRAALDSLLAQTCTQWTALIHDDASDTDVESIVKPYLTDTRIFFVRSNTRLGIGGNWNTCITHGNAQFVQYLFQDDLWSPNYLLRSYEAITSDPTIVFTAANHTYIHENKDTEKPTTYDALLAKRAALQPGKHNGKAYLMEWLSQELHPNIIGEPSFVMMRRSAITQVGPFLNDMPQCLDMEYWTRLLMAGNWFFLPENLGAFRVHADGASAQNSLSGTGIFDRLRTIERVIDSLPQGKERKAAKEALLRALQVMIAKFFARKREGKTLPTKGAGANQLKRFCMRHPLLVGTVLVRYFYNTRKR